MRCEECFPMLDDYVECELDEKDGVKVAAHLSACAACSDYCEELRREQKIYSQYLSGVEATPTLWVGLRAAVEEQRQRRVSPSRRFKNAFGGLSFKLEYIAASVALLIAIGVVIGLLGYESAVVAPERQIVSRNGGDARYQHPPEKLIPEIRSAAPDHAGRGGNDEPADRVKAVRAKNTRGVPAPRRAASRRTTTFDYSKNAARKPTIDEAVAKSEREYVDAIAILLRDIRSRRKQLSPKTLSLLRQSDRTISETRRAVQAQPHDPVAIQYMAMAYDKKVELLRTVATN